MTTSLRPMTLGEILDRSFHIYRQRFLLLLGVAVIPTVLMLAVQLADMEWLTMRSLVKPFRQPGIFLWNMVVALGFYHISSLLGGMVSPAFVKQGSSALFNEECTFRMSLRFFVVRWRSYLWISILKLAAVLVISESLAAGLFIGMGFSLEAAGVLSGSRFWGFASLIVVPSVIGVYLFLRVGACLSLAIPAAALEDVRGTKVLRRSWILSRDSRLRLATVWVLMSAFGTVLSWGLQILVRWGLVYLYWHLHFHRSDHFYEAVLHVLNGAVAALVGPLYPVAITLLYYDQRIRHEGFDIEWMMNAAGMNTPAFAEAPVVPVPVVESGEQPA